MSKSKITKIGVSLAVVVALVGGVIGYNVATGDKGTLTDQAAVREQGVPADGVVFIEPEMVGLADAVSGTADSQAAAKAAFDNVKC